HESAIHFHLAADVDASLHDGSARLEARAGSTVLDIVYPEGQGHWDLVDGLVSPCYGAKVASVHGTYSARTAGPAVLPSVMFPRHATEPPPTIRRLDARRGRAWAVETSRFRDLVLWSADALDSEGVRAIDFEWVWVRHS